MLFRSEIADRRVKSTISNGIFGFFIDLTGPVRGLMHFGGALEKNPRFLSKMNWALPSIDCSPIRLCRLTMNVIGGRGEVSIWNLLDIQWAASMTSTAKDYETNASCYQQEWNQLKVETKFVSNSLDIRILQRKPGAFWPEDRVTSIRSNSQVDLSMCRSDFHEIDWISSWIIQAANLVIQRFWAGNWKWIQFYWIVTDWALVNDQSECNSFGMGWFQALECSDLRNESVEFAITRLLTFELNSMNSEFEVWISN